MHHHCGYWFWCCCFIHFEMLIVDVPWWETNSGHFGARRMLYHFAIPNQIQGLWLRQQNFTLGCLDSTLCPYSHHSYIICTSVTPDVIIIIHSMYFINSISALKSEVNYLTCDRVMKISKIGNWLYEIMPGHLFEINV